MVSEKPDELVRLALRSFGEMPVAKLEDVLAKTASSDGSLEKASGKRPARRSRATRSSSFQTSVRKHPVARPGRVVRRRLVRRLSREQGPRQILDAIAELETAGKLAGLEDTRRGILEDRLAFAIKGAHNTDAPLYARLATPSRIWAF
jgi:hypothetical protein